jgi:hypothetical protein
MVIIFGDGFFSRKVFPRGLGNISQAAVVE